jgi:hypothetical protein
LTEVEEIGGNCECCRLGGKILGGVARSGESFFEPFLAGESELVRTDVYPHDDPLKWIIWNPMQGAGQLGSFGDSGKALIAKGMCSVPRAFGYINKVHVRVSTLSSNSQQAGRKK